ncbi:MAG: hypothetical protein RLZZ319_67, partial [Actinomycetota bacterium]
TFATNVFVPTAGSVNVGAIVVAAASGIALFRFKRSILEVVIAAAGLGLVIALATLAF